MRLPSAQRAGERNPTPVQLADLAPTLLELAGLAADPSLSGHSLLSAVPSERWLSGSLRRGQGFILNWPRKLVRDGRQNCFEVDLARDPLELEPRAASEREFLELSRKLRHGDFPPAVEVGGPAPEEAADLRALGYGGEVEGR
jgi:arylsulfatase A-like enzyme